MIHQGFTLSSWGSVRSPKSPFLKIRLLEGRIKLRKQPCSDEHPEKASEQCIQRSLSYGPDHGSGTIPEEGETDTEDQAADHG